MKQVYKKWKSSEQICTGTVHWREPLTATPRETEEHSLYTSREYINLIFLAFFLKYILTFFFSCFLCIFQFSNGEK